MKLNWIGIGVSVGAWVGVGGGVSVGVGVGGTSVSINSVGVEVGSGGMVGSDCSVGGDSEAPLQATKIITIIKKKNLECIVCLLRKEPPSRNRGL